MKATVDLTLRAPTIEEANEAAGDALRSFFGYGTDDDLPAWRWLRVQSFASASGVIETYELTGVCEFDESDY